jgi:ribosomal protein L7Ae-like RNA K-turn-binding protein
MKVDLKLYFKKVFISFACLYILTFINTKMNRKLITNKNLAWPELNETEHQQINQSLNSFFLEYPLVKRKKPLPQYLRAKKKAKLEVENDTTLIDSVNQEALQKCKLFKRFIRLGINSVTKTLENEPKNVLVVLCCQSSPGLLTRHLLMMCSQSQIPAASIKNLSTNLSKIFNIKTVTAIAVCHSINREDSNEELIDENLLSNVKESINKLKEKVIARLAALNKNPFRLGLGNCYITDLSQVEEKIKNCLRSEKEEKSNDVKMEFKEEEKAEDQGFGSDFIKFKMSNIENPFHSKNFILLDESK